MPAGSRPDEDALGATVLRVAARTRFDPAEEKEAGAFGPLPTGECRTRLAGSSLRGPVRRDRPAGRIEASPGCPGPQGRSGTPRRACPPGGGTGPG